MTARVMRAALQQAVCWEMSTGEGRMVRCLTHGRVVATQEVVPGVRPKRWRVQVADTDDAAAAAAVTLAEALEGEGYRLVTKPVVVVVYPREEERLACGEMPPSLRQRMFSSLGRNRSS